MILPLPGAYASAIHFAALSKRGRQRSDLAMRDAGELIAEIGKLDGQIQQPKPGKSRDAMLDWLHDAVEILKMKIQASGDNPVYRRNCRRILRTIRTSLPTGSRQPARGITAIHDNRRRLARLDTRTLAGRIREMDSQHARLMGTVAVTRPRRLLLRHRWIHRPGQYCPR